MSGFTRDVVVALSRPPRQKPLRYSTLVFWIADANTALNRWMASSWSPGKTWKTAGSVTKRP